MATLGRRRIPATGALADQRFRRVNVRCQHLQLPHIHIGLNLQSGLYSVWGVSMPPEIISRK